MSYRPRWWMLLQALLFPTTRRILQGTQTTFLGRLASHISVPLLSGRNFHITYLPVNEHIEGPSSSFIPEQVLEELVRASAHRVIIRRCTCRDGNQCTHHPIGLACLLLGEGTREIDPAVGRHVDVEDALAHIRQCLDDGLIPFAGRFKADNYLWGVKDRGKLLTVCFCCPCCCMIMNTARYMPQATRDSIVKLQGFKLIVDAERCTACGTCTNACFMEALSLMNGRIIRDENRCKGCGVCLSVCPNQAVSATVDDLRTAIDDLHGRISTLIDYR